MVELLSDPVPVVYPGGAEGCTGAPVSALALPTASTFADSIPKGFTEEIKMLIFDGVVPAVAGMVKVLVPRSGVLPTSEFSSGE